MEESEFTNLVGSFPRQKCTQIEYVFWKRFWRAWDLWFGDTFSLLFIVLHCFALMFIDLHCFPLISIDFHRCSLIFTNFQYGGPAEVRFRKRWCTVMMETLIQIEGRLFRISNFFTDFELVFIDFYDSSVRPQTVGAWRLGWCHLDSCNLGSVT